MTSHLTPDDVSAIARRLADDFHSLDAIDEGLVMRKSASDHNYRAVAEREGWAIASDLTEVVDRIIDRSIKAEPKYAPLAWLDEDANLWVDPTAANLLHWLPETGVPKGTKDAIPWFAHPPVTAEPAPVSEAANAREVIEDILRNDPDRGGAPRLFPVSADEVLKALDARGLTVTDASVDNSDATVRFDLVDGMNVEEWAHKAEQREGTIRDLRAVLSGAADALVAHGFTSDTLESQTLAESIHALAGRGAPSVEQIFHALDPHFTGLVSKRAAAEAIHALYGTPGGTGEGSAVCAGDYNAMHRRAVAAEEREESQHLRAEKVGELLSIAERQRDEANKRSEKAEAEFGGLHDDYERLRAEIERHKAALEAADALIVAKDDVEEAESEVRRLLKAKDKAIGERGLARAAFLQANDAYDAARAAVEAETSEEAGA